MIRNRPMRALRALTGAVLLPISFAPAWAAGRPELGRQLAERWCASCHVVGPGQKEASADVPPFASIARRGDLSESILAAFLSTPHPPMPNLSLSRQDVSDVLAYIRSLQ